MYKKIRPDLVLLDLNMTHIDDFQVMEQLREAEKGSYAPILVLTTQSGQNIQFNALAAEARDFVKKPFDITGVVRRISNMPEIRLLDSQVRDQKLDSGEKSHGKNPRIFSKCIAERMTPIRRNYSRLFR